MKSTSALIKTLNLKPEQIVFEVVETEKIDDYNHLKNILDYYRNKGFSIALDDVGSGYNSIDTIKELYPDYIKVDIGIIRDINLHSYKQKVFNDLFECCQKNNVMLLAEGVETKEEFDYISNNGAQLAQGYYIGRPSTEI